MYNRGMKSGGFGISSRSVRLILKDIHKYVKA